MFDITEYSISGKLYTSSKSVFKDKVYFVYFPDLKSLYLSIQNDCDFFEGSELGKLLLEFPLRRVKAEAEDAEALRHGRLLAVADVPATVRHRGSAGRHKEREQTKTISTCRQISQF